VTRALLAILALVLIALPAGATAQTNAPPGNSAIDEYLETVPAASGNQRPKAGGSAALTKSERARLERLGPDGRALADAVDATAPAAAKAPEPGVRPSSADGRAPLSKVVDAVTGRDGGDGMGLLLPAILLATLLGVISVVVLRRRSVS
jgi:hypothetical protein